jgi:hypothetical protein
MFLLAFAALVGVQHLLTRRSAAAAPRHAAVGLP